MRLLKRLVVILMALIATAIGGAYLYLRQSLPVLNGTLQVAGLSEPIDIIRDADAIPHIFATNKLDGFYGLGYVHAQDRLWQMEFQRRIGFGRLSEVLGPAALPQDRILRTVGFGRAARAAWAAMSAASRKQVEAYVAGVNAFLSTHHGRSLPPEFTLLRFEPERTEHGDLEGLTKRLWDSDAGNQAEPRELLDLEPSSMTKT